MERLDSHLKEVDSLARKLTDAFNKAELLGPLDAQRIAEIEGGIRDSVRFTAVVADEGYWVRGNEIIDSLNAKGFHLIKDPGAWNLGEYLGRNLAFENAEGVKFEVQVHTADSLQAAEDTHKLYEEFRLESTSAERKAELQKMMAEISDRVPIPEGTPTRRK